MTSLLTHLKEKTWLKNMTTTRKEEYIRKYFNYNINIGTMSVKE